MVRDGEADALFSAGNTGATVAAALLRMGRLEGCRRPAIATLLPFPSPVLLLDAGATVSCRPQDLLNFAILGGVLAKRYFGLEGEARVGLVNVGEEPGKGNDLAKEAHRLMDESGIRFVGNVEGRDIASGVADVLVTDGFTGNIVLKTAEGVAREILGMVRSAMTGDVVSKLAAGHPSSQADGGERHGRPGRVWGFLPARRKGLGRDRPRKLASYGRRERAPRYLARGSPA